MMTDVPFRKIPRLEDALERTWLPMHVRRRRVAPPQGLMEEEALEALRDSDERLRLVLEIARLGTWDHDLATGITRYSEAVAPMFGRDRAGFWLSPDELMAYIHPGDRVAIGEAIQATLQRGEPYLVRCRVLGDDGAVRWLESRAVLERDAEGRPERVSGVALDVTESVEADRAIKEAKESLESAIERRTAELTRANRDLGEFAYSVAHDLRAPLRAIVSTSSILMEDEGDRLSQEGRDALGRQAGNALRLAKIVDDLLSFAKLAEAQPKKESFDMTNLARRVAEEVASRRETPHRIDVQIGMRAFGDSSLIGYVLTNLLDNACKFSPEGGDIAMGEEDGVFFVRDTGLGFDMAHAHKLFIAFERLVGHEIEGTGVGLANVKRIVEKHGGRVWAESEPGRGATFWFTLW